MADRDILCERGFTQARIVHRSWRDWHGKVDASFFFPPTYTEQEGGTAKIRASTRGEGGAGENGRQVAR